MASDNVGQAVAVCLAPHNSRTSVGLYKQVLLGEGAPFPIDFVEEWHDSPLLIEAFAEKLRAGWSAACAEHGSKLPVLFTAHSVPTRTIAEGDPYEAQTRETAALVAAQRAGNRRVELRLPEPGNVRRRVARADGRRYDCRSCARPGHTGFSCSPSDLCAIMSRSCSTSTSCSATLRPSVG